MRWILLSTLALLLGCAHLRGSEPASEKIQYAIRFLPKASPAALEVEANFPGSPSGETQLVLPRELYSQETPFDGVQGLEVRSPHCELSSVDAHGRRTIHHPPGARLTIRYHLVQTIHGEFKNTSPMITDRFLHIAGTSLFAHPQWSNDQPIEASIQWLDVPPGWMFANSFAAQQTAQVVRATAFEFQTSIFVAGDFQLEKIEIASRPVFVAIRGEWQFSHAEVIELIRRVITAQREFWRDFDAPYYFIVLMSDGKPCCSYGGHGLTHSFVSYFSPEERSLRKFAWVLAHEHFHYWNGEKMMAESEGPEYWLTEGFTDYYARQINWRAGVISYAEFVDDINAQIFRYYLSTARESTNAQIAASGSSSLPQVKGNTLAGEWNLAIRKATHDRSSLDDFMRTLLVDVGAARLTNARIEATLTKFVGSSARKMMEEVEQGRLIRPSDAALGPCAHVEDWTIGKFEAGFDDPSAATVVRNLKIGSRASAAGLRDGQMILERREVDLYKPWRALEFRIQDEHGTRWIRYLPQSRDLIHIPHFIIDPKSTDPLRC